MLPTPLEEFRQSPSIPPKSPTDSTMSSPSLEVKPPAMQTASASMPPAPRADPPFKPKEPLMGGLEQVFNKEFIAYTGGKPNATWTGLDSLLVPKSRHTNGQFHYISGASSISAEEARHKELEYKFARRGDLITFSRDVKEKLEKFGMNSIAYLPSTITKG
jgi:hypothetical protein